MSQLVLSLFPGLELLDRAFREAGFCVVAGPDKLLGADVRDFHPPAGRFDGVIGGSPCQLFSPLQNLVRTAELKRRKLTYADGTVFAEDGSPVFAGGPQEVSTWLGTADNLIPEFERVVVEAGAAWFLHENSPRAPIPQPAGYAVRDFELCNSSVEGEDGLGQEQERVRRFTFGVRGTGPAPCLLRWIPRAALRLPAASRTGAIATGPTSRPREAKGRVRTQAVVGDARAVPVALGGSGKPKRLRQRAVVAGPGTGVATASRERKTGPPAVDFATVAAHALNGSTSKMPDDFVTTSPTGKTMRFRKPPLTGENGTKYETPRTRQPAITGANQCDWRPKGSAGERRSIAEMLRLQGLPEDLLDDAPFTSKAKRKLVANGVPLPMGRAVAQAVRRALEAIK